MCFYTNPCFASDLLFRPSNDNTCTDCAVDSAVEIFSAEFFEPFVSFSRQNVRVSIPGRIKNFLFSTSGPTKAPVQCVPWAVSPGGKAAGA
jgi:hypothetical protein